MLENDFQKLSGQTLDKFADSLDVFDESGVLELEYQGGIITITLSSGKQFIVNKHAPSKQIWLSSPISGGLHFSYDTAEKEWKLTDGRCLGKLLSDELKTLADIEAML